MRVKLILLLISAAFALESRVLAQESKKIRTGMTLTVPPTLSFTATDNVDWAEIEVVFDNGQARQIDKRNMGNFGILANKPCEILVQTIGDWTMESGGDPGITVNRNSASKYAIQPVLSGSLVSGSLSTGIRFESVTINEANKPLLFAEWTGNGTLNATINPGAGWPGITNDMLTALGAGQRNLVLEFSLIAK